MTTLKSFITVSICVSLLTACSQSKELTKDEMMSIAHENNAKLEKAFLSENLEELVSIYAADARLSPDGDSFYAGKDAIKNFWQADFATSTLVSMHTNTQSVSGNREVIYETGITETEFLKSDSTTGKGSVKFINVWALQPDNTYKLSIDFWNNNKKEN